LTDNGSQYVTWRGKSAFSRELEKRGVRQVVASPRHPQTLGKIERFWGTLWRECVEAAIFLDLGDAQRRIGWFIDHYNFQRPIKGLAAWCRPIVSSAPPPRSCGPSKREWQPIPWSWPGKECPRRRFT
jgi:transposase InsO family protein